MLGHHELCKLVIPNVAVAIDIDEVEQSVDHVLVDYAVLLLRARVDVPVGAGSN